MKLPVILALTAVIGLASCSRDNYIRLDRKKTLGNDFVKVTDSLYAQQTEISNVEYTSFLASLRNVGKDSLYTLYNNNILWVAPLRVGEPMRTFYDSHPAYNNFPAVNISYEGAVAYCHWLTETYNKNPKRAYKKVVFRLPTEEEWMYAARGGREYADFPWGGPYLRNSRGMYLANFQQVFEADLKDTVIDGKRRAIGTITGSQGVVGGFTDNAMITTPVESYFPNGYGLYNMAGNVSEMLAEKGRTKGGNWHSLGYYLRIDAPDEFGGQLMESSPYVGFRVFAQVIEK